MSSPQEGERQFEPTEQRRAQFRKDGRFARSRDAAGVAATFAVLGVLFAAQETLGRACARLFQSSLGDVSALSDGRATFVLRLSTDTLATLAFPAAIAASLGATLVSLVQTGFRVNLDAVGFKASRLDALARLKRMLSAKQSGVEALMSLLRVGLVGYVAYLALAGEVPELLTLSRTAIDVSVIRIAAAASRVVAWTAAAVLGLAAFDYAQSRLRLAQEMKMTGREMMEDMRRNDGDVKVKGRMRARARAHSKKSVFLSVRNADVILADAAHLAVALRYEAAGPAPVVVVKGKDDDAIRILAEARKGAIAIVLNGPLARALASEANVGQPVPRAHFASVARILSSVYRAQGRGLPGTRRAS